MNNHRPIMGRRIRQKNTDQDFITQISVQRDAAFDVIFQDVSPLENNECPDSFLRQIKSRPHHFFQS